MTSTPVASILMVARNTAPFIDAAIESARKQTLEDIEIVVVDDGSTDGTWDIANAHARMDRRIRLIDGPRTGLSAVRNVSLRAARGRFGVILDSDDILHPDHVDGLVRYQARTGGRICAANMVQFVVRGGDVRADTFAAGRPWQTVRSVSAGAFVQAGMIGGSDVSLGYLKPMFDLDFLRSHRLHYDERLRIGEDFDLVLRAMLAGADYHFLPQPTYYYRRHPGSTSHRLTALDLHGLIEATDGYFGQDAGVRRLLAARRVNLEGALRQVQALAAWKSLRIWQGLRLVVRHREARRLTCASLSESVRKRLGMRTGQVPCRENAEPLSEHLRAITRSLPTLAPTPSTETPCVR